MPEASHVKKIRFRVLARLCAMLGMGGSHTDSAAAFAFCFSSHNSAKYSMSIR